MIDLSAKKHWTWHDVLEEAENASKQYVTAGQGKKGVVRRFFRDLGDNEPAVSPWLCWTRNDEYLSLLHSGLALMFAVSSEQLIP